MGSNIAGTTRLKISTNSRPKGNIKHRIRYTVRDKNTRKTTSEQRCQHRPKLIHQYAENNYVKLRKSLKSTHLIVRLNAVSEEKSTVSLGKEFQMLTVRSVKNVDLTVLVHWRLNSL